MSLLIESLIENNSEETIIENTVPYEVLNESIIIEMEEILNECMYMGKCIQLESTAVVAQGEKYQDVEYKDAPSSGVKSKVQAIINRCKQLIEKIKSVFKKALVFLKNVQHKIAADMKAASSKVIKFNSENINKVINYFDKVPAMLCRVSITDLYHAFTDESIIAEVSESITDALEYINDVSKETMEAAQNCVEGEVIAKIADYNAVMKTTDRLETSINKTMTNNSMANERYTRLLSRMHMINNDAIIKEISRYGSLINVIAVSTVQITNTIAMEIRTAK